MRKSSIDCDTCGKSINILTDDAISFVEITYISTKIISIPTVDGKNNISSNIKTEKEAKTRKADLCKECTIELDKFLTMLATRNLEKKVEDNTRKEKNVNKRNKRNISGSIREVKQESNILDSEKQENS